MDDNFIPAGIPPPGVTPNLINPESVGYRLVIVAAVFPVVTGVFLALRLYTAHFLLKRWHLDDCKLDEPRGTHDGTNTSCY